MVIVVVVLRQPGVEPGPHRWQRRILTVELLALIIHTHTSLFSLLSSSLHRPGIEPGPRAWKARILTIELSTLLGFFLFFAPTAGIEPATT